MGLKAALSIPYAKWVKSKLDKAASNAVLEQHRTLSMLVKKGRNTAFGKDHGFSEIFNHKDFAERVPIRDYEELATYIDRIKGGEKDVLWPGLPLYFCKTSGTTSGAKYIPLTRASLPNHIGSARNALLSYIAETSDARFVNGKMIFLQGSPKLDKLPSGIRYGRLSGIVANHVPAYLLKNRMPSYETNCIEDWEEKVDQIVEETSKEDMTVISGIPSWVQMYFERLLEKSGKKAISELFPNFSLFVYGGVNFGPYAERFRTLIGKDIPSIELYPASEGFIAYQDSQEEDGLLLVVNSGIFYEFIPSDQFFSESPPRLSLEEVELGVNYVLIINSNAGLWGYNIGDTVKFVSLLPPRIKVTGRIKHFTSAFGEHVIAEEVEEAMKWASSSCSMSINEFHVAPQTNPGNGLPFHEWLVDFDRLPESLTDVEEVIDRKMQELNPYYLDLREGNILRRVVLTPLKEGAFTEYMRSVGRLGGQNKVPRLANDRNVAEFLEKFRLQ